MIDEDKYKLWSELVTKQLKSYKWEDSSYGNLFTDGKTTFIEFQGDEQAVLVYLYVIGNTFDIFGMEWSALYTQRYIEERFGFGPLFFSYDRWDY